jgi:hypothetical protein
VEIAKAIAAQLQRPLEIVPFESELETTATCRKRSMPC